VLWWYIYNLLVKLAKKRLAPKYLMFENVDRLINSPRQDRGRDFAIILACLRDLGYAVEWRIINAADYGMPQRRRRTFILGYRKGTEIYSQMKKARERAVTECGVICSAFSARYSETKTFVLDKDIRELSNGFSLEHGGKTPFLGAGFMLEGRIWTARVEEALNNIIQPPVVLKDCLEAQCETSSFRVDDDLVHDSERGWAFHKGPKKRKRKDSSTGYEYLWAEGGMPLTDDLDRPARTILTSEGGASPGRSKHLIKTDGIYRRLTPVELERISMFPSNHTEIGKDPQRGDYRISDSQRAFFMGNALVVGVVERLGYTLAQKVKQGDEKMKKSSEVKAKAR
jgi:DNA (cytosine-5)-methyltransferase 1